VIAGHYHTLDVITRESGWSSTPRRL